MSGDPVKQDAGTAVYPLLLLLPLTAAAAAAAAVGWAEWVAGLELGPLLLTRVGASRVHGQGWVVVEGRSPCKTSTRVYSAYIGGAEPSQCSQSQSQSQPGEGLAVAVDGQGFQGFTVAPSRK